MTAMRWLSWCCIIFIVAMQVLVVVRGMQTGLVIARRYTGIRDWTIDTSPLRWQIHASNFTLAWLEEFLVNSKWKFKAQLSLWDFWPAGESLPAHYCLTLSVLPVCSSLILPLHPFIPNPSTCLLPRGWDIYNVGATGISLLLRDILVALVPILSVMTVYLGGAELF